MHCAICDTEDSDIHYDYARKEFTVCRNCSDVISDTLMEFEVNEEEDDNDGG